MPGITVRHIDGRLLAMKRTGGSGRERLDHEREALEHIDHPGVVQVVAVDHEDFGADTLATRFVGPENWEQRPPTTADGIVTGAVMLAGTLADLHDLGLCHGAVRPEHVVVAPDGRPVLCGFADAVTADDEARRADVAALGEMIDALTEAAPRPLARNLASIADRCRDGSIDAAGAARLLDGLERTERSVPALPSRRTAVSGAVGAGAFAVVLWLVLSGDPRPPEDSASTSRTAASTTSEVDDPVSTPSSEPAPTTTSAAPARTSTTSLPPGRTTAAPSSEPPASTTSAPPSDEPPTDIQAIGGVGGDAPEVVHDGRRYTVGAPGDLVVVGDWNCDGTSTPALLRPGTGEVAAFDAWPGPDADIVPAWVEVVVGADAIEAEPAGECDRVRVRSGSTSQLVGPT